MTRVAKQGLVAMAHLTMQMFRNWQVEDDEACTILGGIDRDTYLRWKSGAFGTVPQSVEARFVTLIGIHWGLRLMFSDPQRGYAWMSRPNDTFDGATPLQMMARGDMASLIRLRDYLIAQIQIW